MTNQTKDKAAPLENTTRLAYARTQLALERTMMAWVRTATSLITFGFSVYKFFQIELNSMGQPRSFISPRLFGLIMITFGLVSLLMGTVQHVVSMRQIRAQWPEAPRSVAAMLAALIAILGLGALTAAVFRQ